MTNSTPIVVSKRTLFYGVRNDRDRIATHCVLDGLNSGGGVARFSILVHNGAGAHPASYKII